MVITAAVVGVVLNLAVWLALHTLFEETTPVIAGPLASTHRSRPVSVQPRSPCRWGRYMIFMTRARVITILLMSLLIGLAFYGVGVLPR
jgi:chromate transporter